MPLHVSSTTCLSSGGQNCIIQHLVSSHTVGGRPVYNYKTRFCALSWLITKNICKVADFIRLEVTENGMIASCMSVNYY